MDRLFNLVKQSTSPTEGIIQLLENTTIGTNGTLYRLLDTRTKIHLLRQPTFHYLERNGVVIANVTLCKRTVYVLDEAVHSAYIRYVAFSKKFQGGTGATKGKSAFHSYYHALFTPQNLQQKHVLWAYIDPENLRSFNLNKVFDFTTIGTFQTIAFSRFFPKIKKGVSVVSPDDKQTVLAALNEQYKHHNFFQTDHLFTDNLFYTLKVAGEIVAGIHARPVQWKIEALPGFSGKLILKYGSRIPFLKRIINPAKHAFLATEGLYWKPGYEEYVSTLLEGVLALTGQYSLLIWKDSEDHHLSELSLNWGVLQRIKKNNAVHIVAKLQNYAPHEIDALKQSKKYLRGFDMT